MSYRAENNSTGIFERKFGGEPVDGILVDAIDH